MGRLPPGFGRGGGAGPEVTEVWNAAAAWVQGAVPAWLPRDPGRVEEGVGPGREAGLLDHRLNRPHGFMA